VEDDKKANFLDLIGQTKALLCEMNLIDQNQVEGAIPENQALMIDEKLKSELPDL